MERYSYDRSGALIGAFELRTGLLDFQGRARTLRVPLDAVPEAPRPHLTPEQSRWAKSLSAEMQSSVGGLAPRLANYYAAAVARGDVPHTAYLQLRYDLEEMIECELLNLSPSAYFVGRFEKLLTAYGVPRRGRNA